MEQLSLFDLNNKIKDCLKNNLDQSYWVVAEIGEMRLNQKGHCYLELVEKKDDEILAKNKDMKITPGNPGVVLTTVSTANKMPNKWQQIHLGEKGGDSSKGTRYPGRDSSSQASRRESASSRVAHRCLQAPYFSKASHEQ